MAVGTDLWRKLNSVACETGSWMDAIKQASLRWLFPAIDVRHVDIDVATTSTPVLSARQGCRRFLILENDSDTTIYCSLDGNPAALNHGVRLNANGGNLLLDITTTGPAIFAIHGDTSPPGSVKRLIVTEDLQ